MKTKMRFISIIVFSMIFLFISPPHSAQAADCSWIGGSGDWNQAANWSCGDVPGIGDAAIINNGGTVISWGQSTDLFTGLLEITEGDSAGEFTLPFANGADQARRDGLNIPGSLVRIELMKDHPLTYGMPASMGVFYRGNPLFTSTIPRFDMDRRVIGRFPKKEILMSGFCEKEELLAGSPAMLWIRKGRGQMVLYSFNPQFRASTQGAYKLLFNALFLPPADQQILRP